MWFRVSLHESLMTQFIYKVLQVLVYYHVKYWTTVLNVTKKTTLNHKNLPNIS